MAKDSWLRTGLVAMAVGLASLGAVSAADTVCAAAKPGELMASTIGLVADASLPAGTLESALAAWHGCPGAGVAFPVLSSVSRAAGAVRVRFVSGGSQGGRCGYFSGAEIVLFASAVDRAGRAVPCGSPAANLAHELGHVLGLADAPRDARCAGFIMSADDPRPGHRRAVQPAECSAVDAHWRTEAEGAVLSSVWRRIDGPTERWVPGDLAPSADASALIARATPVPFDDSALFAPY